MRYIGSKIKLLNELEDFILSKIDIKKEKELTFLDLFSGTGSVALHFKKYFKIYTNDIMEYAFHLSQGHVVLNKMPEFKKLKERLKLNDGFNVVDYLNKMLTLDPDLIGFIEKEYSCYENEINNINNLNKRAFFTQENGKKIDTIRKQIKEWKYSNLISNYEESYLIACLIEAVTKISNTTGTYASFLKEWDKRALKPLILTKPILIDNKKENKAFNKKAEEFVNFKNAFKDEFIDVCYIDPPYNSRQYSGNYHLLETIVKYDNPNIKGKTGIRLDSTELKSSNFCSKLKVKNSFIELLTNLKAKHIFISYNSDGLLTKQEIEEILLSIPLIKKETYDCKTINYNAYQSKIVKKNTVEEFVFYIKKEF